MFESHWAMLKTIGILWVCLALLVNILWDYQNIKKIVIKWKVK